MPSRHYLRKGARHANYEMGMLHDTAAQLRRRSITGLQRAALLESWALHLRNLIEFFHPTAATKSDTVIADWYVQDPIRWGAALPKLKPAERTKRVALHKLLAHVSYLRDARKSKWSDRHHRIVTKRLRLFHAHLSQKRKNWFPRVLK